jgi:hypothetical protein
MKKDLEVIFKRIRNIKAKLAAQQPEAFRQAVGDAVQTKGTRGNVVGNVLLFISPGDMLNF